MQATLLNSLSEILGPELCLQFILPEIICLMEDPVFRVRKSAAQNVDAVFRTAGPLQANKRLLPSFLKLCGDEIWGVRKAAAESLVNVSKALDPAARASELIPVFDKLANDTSKWVKNAAQAQSGPFLASLPASKITPTLLSHYSRSGFPDVSSSANFSNALNTGNNSHSVAGSASNNRNSTKLGENLSAISSNNNTSSANNSATNDSDSSLAAACAHAFPAVALKLGRDRWPEIKNLFSSLSRDVNAKVRRPLAFSLHELARILGPTLAEEELLPAFEAFLRDPSPDVRTGAMKNMATLLAVLAPGTRESYLPVLGDTLGSPAAKDWRFRFLFATQLPQLAHIFSPAATFSVVVPIAFRLISDTTAAVRVEAVAAFAPLLTRLSATEDPSLLADIISRLVLLASSNTCNQRLLFIRLSGYLGNSITGIDYMTFRTDFLPSLLNLAKDPVRNVRRSLAELFAPLSAAAEAFRRPSGQPTSPLHSGNSWTSLSLASSVAGDWGYRRTKQFGFACSVTAPIRSSGAVARDAAGTKTNVGNNNSSVSVPTAALSPLVSTLVENNVVSTSAVLNANSTTNTESNTTRLAVAAAAAAAAASNGFRASIGRRRALTSDLPVGIDEDLCPRWAWALPGASSNNNSVSLSPGRTAVTLASLAETGEDNIVNVGTRNLKVVAVNTSFDAPTGIASDIFEALVILANDVDTETSTRLAPSFLSKHRVSPLIRPGTNLSVTLNGTIVSDSTNKSPNNKTQFTESVSNIENVNSSIDAQVDDNENGILLTLGEDKME
jgi:HEAT repeat